MFSNCFWVALGNDQALNKQITREGWTFKTRRNVLKGQMKILELWRKLVGFKKILVAIDRSSLALLVFEQALELAKKESASFMVFHCLDSANMRQLTSLIDVEEETEQVQKWL